MVIAEPLVEAVQPGETGAWPMRHGRGDGPVQRHHGVGGHGLKQVVQGQDLGPVGGGVGGGLVVQGRDGGLHLVFASVSPAQHPGDQGHPFGDEIGVPAAAVLFGEGDQLAARTAAGRAPGVGEQHQGEQTGHLRVLGHGSADDPGQPDGLAGQIGARQAGAAARGVPLVEQQVKDMQHRSQPLRTLIGRREREPLAGGFDLGLGAADPLGHGRLGNQERGSDLAGGQAADRPESERDGRRWREGRVAAHEHEDQRVVPPRRRFRRRAGP